MSPSVGSLFSWAVFSIRPFEIAHEEYLAPSIENIIQNHKTYRIIGCIFQFATIETLFLVSQAGTLPEKWRRTIWSTKSRAIQRVDERMHTHKESIFIFCLLVFVLTTYSRTRILHMSMRTGISCAGSVSFRVNIVWELVFNLDSTGFLS